LKEAKLVCFKLSSARIVQLVELFKNITFFLKH